MSNGHLNVYSSSGQMDISKCPSDIWICPLVQWTNGHIEMSIGHLNVQSSNGRMDMSNASITCKHISAWVPHLELIHNRPLSRDVTYDELRIWPPCWRENKKEKKVFEKNT